MARDRRVEILAGLPLEESPDLARPRLGLARHDQRWFAGKRGATSTMPRSFCRMHDAVVDAACTGCSAGACRHRFGQSLQPHGDPVAVAGNEMVDLRVADMGRYGDAERLSARNDAQGQPCRAGIFHDRHGQRAPARLDLPFPARLARISTHKRGKDHRTGSLDPSGQCRIAVFGFIIPDSSHCETLIARARKPLCLNGKTGPMRPRLSYSPAIRGGFQAPCGPSLRLRRDMKAVELFLVLGAAQFAQYSSNSA